MGQYININSKGIALLPNFKVKQLIADGAKIMETPKYVPEKTVIVMENPYFDAAAYAYDEKEFEYFKTHNPPQRPITFLEYEHAKKLAE